MKGENEILHEIFRIVSRFPHYISCFFAESRFPLGQCPHAWESVAKYCLSTELCCPLFKAVSGNILRNTQVPGTVSNIGSVNFVNTLFFIIFFYNIFFLRLFYDGLFIMDFFKMIFLQNFFIMEIFFISHFFQKKILYWLLTKNLWKLQLQ